MRVILAVMPSGIESRLRRHAVVVQLFTEYAAEIVPSCGWDLPKGTERITPAHDALLLRLRARLEGTPQPQDASG